MSYVEMRILDAGDKPEAGERFISGFDSKVYAAVPGGAVVCEGCAFDNDKWKGCGTSPDCISDDFIFAEVKE